MQRVILQVCPTSLLLQVSHWFFLSRLIQANANIEIVISSVTASRAIINDREPTNTEELVGDVGIRGMATGDIDISELVNEMLVITVGVKSWTKKEVGVT